MKHLPPLPSLAQSRPAPCSSARSSGRSSASSLARSLAFLSACLLTSLTTPAHAADASAPSQLSADASGMVVAGSLLSVAAAGSVVVTGMQVSAGGVELILEGASQAGKATVRLSGQAVRGLSIAAGTVLEVVATATGHVLVFSGKALAFVPNEAGKALLHHARTGT